MKNVNTNNAPKAVGPYSQAVTSKGFVFCSGQIGLDPETGEMVGNDIESQTNQVIKNLNAVLIEADSSLDQVIKTTCFLKNMDDYAKFNEVYAKSFTQHPARSTVEVSRLPKDALVEIEAIAEV